MVLKGSPLDQILVLLLVHDARDGGALQRSPQKHIHAVKSGEDEKKYRGTVLTSSRQIIGRLSPSLTNMTRLYPWPCLKHLGSYSTTTTQLGKNTHISSTSLHYRIIGRSFTQSRNPRWLAQLLKPSASPCGSPDPYIVHNCAAGQTDCLMTLTQWSHYFRPQEIGPTGHSLVDP